MAGHELDPEYQIKVKKLGERITGFRKALGYTSYETFANEKNIHRAQYWRYEKGENIKVVNLAKLAKALEVSFEDLTRGIFD